MNPTSYTYNGILVNYTDTQKGLVSAAQKIISDLQQQVRDIQSNYNSLESQIQDAISAVSNNPHGACWKQNKIGLWSKDDNCYNSQNSFWKNGRAQQTAMQTQIDQINNVQLPQATKALNDTLTTIQNDIKLQIQAQQSNTNAANPPSLILALQNQTEKDKLQQEQNIKMFAFFLIAVVVVTIVVVVIRKI